MSSSPPQSQTSIHFDVGLTAAESGSVSRLYLAVDDVEAARADLISRGADVSEGLHYDRGPGDSREFDSRVPGPDTQNGGSYTTCASFNDSEGNGWLLQQISGRLPGRVWED